MINSKIKNTKAKSTREILNLYLIFLILFKNFGLKLEIYKLEIKKFMHEFKIDLCP